MTQEEWQRVAGEDKAEERTFLAAWTSSLYRRLSLT